MCFRKLGCVCGRGVVALVPDSQARRVLGLLVAVAAVLGSPSLSFATGVTLPDTGVDLPGLVQAGITAIGTAITIIVGAYFGYLAVRIVMKWAHKMA